MLLNNNKIRRLGVYGFLAPRVGLEPTTPRLTAVCSTIELSRNIKFETYKVLYTHTRNCQVIFSLFIFFYSICHIIIFIHILLFFILEHIILFITLYAPPILLFNTLYSCFGVYFLLFCSICPANTSFQYFILLFRGIFSTFLFYMPRQYFFSILYTLIAGHTFHFFSIYAHNS